MFKRYVIDRNRSLLLALKEKLKSLFSLNRKWIFSIGIYEGESPFVILSSKNVNNPVLTFQDVTDTKAESVADPFMVKEGSDWYMFFEVMNSATGLGEIGLAISNNGFNWSYKQIVLKEPFHLAYPYVFKWKDEYYMVPDTHTAFSVKLYKASSFPAKWQFLGNLLCGKNFVDSSLFNYKDKWWMFTTDTIKNDRLLLYYADDLMGPWKGHAKNPIVGGNAHISRPAGRILLFNNKIFRFAQDDYPCYGNSVRAFEITELTTTAYLEQDVSSDPILRADGFGWNKDGSHHIDIHQIEKDKWIACVDGFNIA
jgi:hypothetical protein